MVFPSWPGLVAPLRSLTGLIMPLVVQQEVAMQWEQIYLSVAVHPGDVSFFTILSVAVLGRLWQDSLRTIIFVQNKSFSSHWAEKPEIVNKWERV